MPRRQALRIHATILAIISSLVTPAKAGVQRASLWIAKWRANSHRGTGPLWIPACAGMTLVLTFGTACSSEVSEGRGTLPPGMQDDLVPDIDYDLYLYFNPGAAVAVDHQRFLSADQEELLALDGDDDVAITSISMVAASLEQFGGLLTFATSSDALLAGSLLEQSGGLLTFATSSDALLAGSLLEQLGGLPTFATSSDAELAANPVEDPLTIAQVASTTVQIIRGDPLWVEEISRQLASAELVALREKSPQAWNMLTNLPASEDDPPIAAGFISTDGDLIQGIADSAGIQVPGLDTAFGMVRVSNVAFGIYSKLPERIPEEIDVELLDSLDTGVVLVGSAGYAGVAVAFLVRSIAGKIGMDTIGLDNTNARYLELEDSHLIIKNKGSLIYATVAGSRARAEELMLRALAE